MKTMIILPCAVWAVVLTNAACMPADPCLKVPPPSPELIRIAQDPRIEVDYVLSESVECDMVGNRWEREQD